MDHQPITHSVRELGIQVLSTQTGTDYQWKVYDGTTQFMATLEDRDFKNRLGLQEEITPKDVLMVRLAESQFIRCGKLAPEYVIVEIKERRANVL